MDKSFLEVLTKLFGGAMNNPSTSTQSFSRENNANNYYPGEIHTQSATQEHSQNNYNSQSFQGGINQYNYSQNSDFNQNYNQTNTQNSQTQNNSFSNQNPFSNLFNNSNPQLMNMLLSMMGGKNLSSLSDIMSNQNTDSKNEKSTSPPPKDDIIL